MKKYILIFIFILIAFSCKRAECAVVIDDMDSTSGWIKEPDPEGSYMLTPSIVSGYSKNAVKIEYDLGSGSWVQIGKVFSELVYDDFNDGEKPNNMSGNSGSMGDDSNANDYCYDSFVKDSWYGDYALKLGYGTGGTWSGYWSFLRYDESGYDVKKYGNLEFYVKGNEDELKFRVELKDTTNTNDQILISTYITVKKTYQPVAIPLDDFPNVDFSNLKQVNIIFDLSPATGEVYIDEIRFTPYGDTIGSDLNEYNAFRFRYKGDGNSNNLEFKISDDDNTTYIKKLYGVTDTEGKWNTAVIPYEDLSLFLPGDDDDLNLSKIKKIWFTVSKGEGGSGTLSVDNLEYIVDRDFKKSRKGKLISKIEVVNNPFSPNDDGIKEKAEFVYTLSQSAWVKLQIYDLSGEIVYEKAYEKKDKGTDSISWSGTYTSGGRVKNGLYFYRLSAKNDSKSDDFKHVVGVFR